MPKLMSITECARYHGVTRAAIHAAIKRGALPAKREGRVWMITEEDCLAYQPMLDPQAKGNQGAAVRWSNENQSETEGRVILYCYGGDPPSDQAVRQRLQITGQQYSYIVATAAQERRRKNLALQHQKVGKKSYLVFHKFLRYQLNEKPLTRAEERVALLRAAHIVAQDPEMEKQLKHDVYAWRDALGELEEQGVDLSNDIPKTLQEKLVNPFIGQVLKTLHSEYQAEQQQHRKQPFEKAAYAYLISDDFEPTPHIVMEGFTFLTELQQQFIKVCVERGATVHILFPYRSTQAYGFEIMRRTYHEYLNYWDDFEFTQASVLQTEDEPSLTNLVRLQQSLFAEEVVEAKMPQEDLSVTLESYNHRNQEIAECIQRVKNYLKNGRKADEIAVVTRNAAEIQALLQEEAALQDLRDAEGRKITLGIQPRQLLLTPLGRFVLNLYKIWQDGSLTMNVDQFEEILASGWLGAHVQATTEQFYALKSQIFARCANRESWQKSLTDLLRLERKLPRNSRLPVASTDENIITLWEQVIEALENICRKLFSVGKKTIGEHVEYLLDELSNLAPEKMLEAERQVLYRIEDVLLELADSASLLISSDEFGEILNSLVQERSPDEMDDEGGLKEPDEIWITAPEGIDCSQRKIVFFLGVDNKRSPRQYSEPWPFYTRKIDEHQEKERYFFLAVVQSAKQHLHLSYARTDEDENYRPSPYLEEASAVLGLSIKERSDLQEIGELEDVPALRRPLAQARRKRYELAEIVHFKLCPFRYQSERLDLNSRQYRTPFQMRFLAQGVWINLIFQHLVQKKKKARGQKDIQEMFLAAMAHIKNEVKAYFPGLRELDWVTIERYVRRTLENDAEFLSQKNFPVSVELGKPANYVVTDNDRVVQVEVNVHYAIRKGSFPYPYTNDLMREEWLIPGKIPEASDPIYTEVEEVKVFASQYHAVQWWKKATESAFYYDSSRDQNNDFAKQQVQEYKTQQEEIRQTIKDIEAGRYPKHRGEHCRYCPLYGGCLGLSEEEIHE